MFIDDGVLSLLEGYSQANEAWPDEVDALELRYWTPERDLAVFQLVLIAAALWVSRDER